MPEIMRRSQEVYSLDCFNCLNHVELPTSAVNGHVESACRAYVSRIHGTPGEYSKLMAGLSRHLASVEWQRALADDPSGRFIPNMEQFISNGGYLDHPPPAPEEPERGTSPAMKPSDDSWLRLHARTGG
jgi:hypothetical protein